MGHKRGNFRAEFFAVIGAIITAPAVVATVFSIFNGVYVSWPLTFVVAFVWTVIFAIPVYAFVFKPRNWTGWWTGPLCGFGAGAILPLILALFLPSSFQFEEFIYAGLLGASGGTAAWVVWKLVHKYCYRSYSDQDN